MNPAGKLLTATLLALLGAGLAHCVHPHPVEPDIVVTSIDGGEDPEEDATSPCGASCANLRRLGCPEGAPSPGGATCYEVCRRAVVMLDTTCVMRATTRAGLSKCSVRCVP